MTKRVGIGSRLYIGGEVPNLSVCAVVPYHATRAAEDLHFLWVTGSKRTGSPVIRSVPPRGGGPDDPLHASRLHRTTSRQRQISPVADASYSSPSLIFYEMRPSFLDPLSSSSDRNIQYHPGRLTALERGQ
ncbi:unnamed protein product [Calypogeia fissa]